MVQNWQRINRIKRASRINDFHLNSKLLNKKYLDLKKLYAKYINKAFSNAHQNELIEKKLKFISHF